MTTIPVQTAMYVGKSFLDHRTTVATITSQGGQVTIAVHEAGAGCKRVITCDLAELKNAIEEELS